MMTVDQIYLDKTITIGIPAHGNSKITKVCLDFLLKSTKGDFELILVDDCSQDNGATKELFLSIKQFHKNLKIYSFDKNKSQFGSMNCIFCTATGNKIIFLSNDIFVTSHYLGTLIKVSEIDKSFGIVRGVSNFVDNGKERYNIRESWDNIKKMSDIFSYSKKIYKKNNKFFEEDYLTGDAFLVKKDVINKIGYIDDIFFGFWADHDFSVRAKRAGFKLIVAQGAFAWHQQAANFLYLDKQTLEKKKKERFKLVDMNWKKFKKKYNLSKDLIYNNINLLPWNKLNKVEFKKSDFVNSQNFSKFLL